ncbi:Quinolone resistance protein NorB [Jeotgalicoccus saudimassiliensis]|uniref:Quinolone resistance protein NorB n=1 Tax=Jeotgalicoccus saudimassiliensis TaxID=1461582 RepID=A0A078M9N0_9STAP|nr:MFS transporter [Jeotgalicoccus saudimassiliensis]CEA03035.1 Quinolone resistance protein NorB [Jeotgalicoccus saudimassiliensis]
MSQTIMKAQTPNRIILGIILTILTYWLFAQAFLNIAPEVQATYSGTSSSIINLSVSLTSLITGIFMVASGNIADKIGYKKITIIGIFLSIIGSVIIILPFHTSFLIIGRIVQGFSAAMIMPATISIFNNIFEGEKRRKALSYWSLGAFGGTGLASLFAGTMATFVAWQWIFIVSIALSIAGLFLIKNLKDVQDKNRGPIHFDFAGLAVFVVMIGALSIFITQGETIGWTSIASIVLIAVFVIGLIVFIVLERSKRAPFLELTLFTNKAFLGTVVTNFLLNTAIGSLALFNIYMQQGLGMTAFSASLVTIPYIVTMLASIKIGEKSIGKFGPKRALVTAPVLLGLGLIMLSLTFFEGTVYIVSCLIGFAFFGIGIGLFATPALDTAVSTTPKDKVGVASAIFKMASTLGGAFGIAIIVSVYSALSATVSLAAAGSVAFIVNVGLLAFAFVFALVVIPKTSVKDK